MLTVESLRSNDDQFKIITTQDIPTQAADGFTVGPRTEEKVKVQFAPAGIGEQSGVLTIQTDDPGNETVNVSMHGTVKGSPRIRVNPARLDFGKLRIHKTKKEFRTIRNAGEGLLEIERIETAGDFRSDLRGFDLGPNQQIELGVVFNPKDLGSREGELRITSNDPDQRTVTVDLVGISETPPRLDAPEEVDFGTIVIDTAPGHQTGHGENEKSFVVWNIGGDDVETVRVETHLPQFVDVNPNEFCLGADRHREVTVGVTVTPVFAGRGFEASLDIVSDDPDVDEVQVQLIAEVIVK